MTTRKTARKVAFAVATLCAALILPGSAVASHNPPINHHTCDPAVSPGCPAFEVDMLVGVQNPITAAPSSLTFQYSQPDRRMPVMRAEYFLPKGWRFGGLNNLDDAQDAGGAPATDCNDGIFNASGNLQKAEALSSATGMRVIVNQFRDNPSDETELLLATGLFVTSSDTYDYNQNRSVSFLDWDGTTARFCYLHRNTAANADYGIASQFVQSGTLMRLAGDPDFDWKVSLDVSSVFKDAAFRDEQGSIVKHDITLSELTAGNWNRNETTGELEKVQFSTTPTLADNYKFRGVFSTCAGGLDTATASGCTDIGAPGTADDFTTQSLDQIIPISPPSNNLRHDFGKLTGPATPSLCFNAVCNLGLVRGATSFNATWSEPALPKGSQVKGYVVVLAEPGDQKSRYFRRIITNPAYNADPDYNGAACTGGSCGTTFSFPLTSTDGSTVLTGDGKYHVALITLYTDSSRRSDNLCDNGTGPGIACPVTEPRIQILDPGVHSWQVLIRPDAWPEAYVEVLDDDSTRTYDPVTNRLLLVDFTAKRAEFILWNTNDKVAIYGANSNTIQGQTGMGGLTLFGSASTAGATQNFRVNGTIDPLTGLAVGTFTIYDLKNPGLQPPTISGYPTVNADPFCPVVDAATFGLYSIFFGFSSTCAVYAMSPV